MVGGMMMQFSSWQALRFAKHMVCSSGCCFGPSKSSRSQIGLDQGEKGALR